MSGAADNEIVTLEPEDLIDIDLPPQAGAVIDLTFLAPGRDLRQAEAEVIRLTNELRRQRGLAVLARNPQLDRAALDHTLEMVEYSFLDHIGHFGSRLKDRALRAGYVNGVLLGENLARGQRTAQEAVDGWLASPGHRANLLHPGFREIGVACLEGKVVGPEGQPYTAIYWTQNFGSQEAVPALYSVAMQQTASALMAVGRRMEQLAGGRPSPSGNPKKDDVEIEWLDD